MHKYVTDHAFVRYIERVHGIKVDEIKDEMVAHGVKEAIDAGAKKVRIDGIDFYISDDKKVKTIFGEESALASRKQKDLEVKKEPTVKKGEWVRGVYRYKSK